MSTTLKVAVLLTLFALSACGTDPRDRTQGGAAAGAATGASIGLLGGPIGVALGAVIGGGAGALTGASTSPNTLNLGGPIWAGSSGGQ
jgi:uncharacterized membrane protein